MGLRMKVILLSALLFNICFASEEEIIVKIMDGISGKVFLQPTTKDEQIGNFMVNILQNYGFFLEENPKAIKFILGTQEINWNMYRQKVDDFPEIEEQGITLVHTPLKMLENLTA